MFYAKQIPLLHNSEIIDKLDKVDKSIKDVKNMVDEIDRKGLKLRS